MTMTDPVDAPYALLSIYFTRDKRRFSPYAISGCSSAVVEIYAKMSRHNELCFANPFRTSATLKQNYQDVS
jgi:hypothetical protein